MVRKSVLLKKRKRTTITKITLLATLMLPVIKPINAAGGDFSLRPCDKDAKIMANAPVVKERGNLSEINVKTEITPKIRAAFEKPLLVCIVYSGIKKSPR